MTQQVKKMEMVNHLRFVSIHIQCDKETAIKIMKAAADVIAEIQNNKLKNLPE